jgi:hypothetical protein
MRTVGAPRRGGPTISTGSSLSPWRWSRATDVMPKTVRTCVRTAASEVSLTGAPVSLASTSASIRLRSAVMRCRAASSTVTLTVVATTMKTARAMRWSRCSTTKVW